MFDELFDNHDVCNDANENTPLQQVTPFDTPSLISQSASCSCSCSCGKCKGVSIENKYEKGSTSFNNNKQICFNCGIGGHIARNCQNRIFVHYMSPRGENESRGRSLTRKSSRTRSRDDDWKDDRSRKGQFFRRIKRFFITKSQTVFQNRTRFP